MSRGPSVTVAGAGALGLSAALALAEAGGRVTVSDPGEARASSIAAGMLAPVFEAILDDAVGDLDLLLAARDLWPGLAARAGIALDQSGTAAAGTADWLADIAGRLDGLGVPAAELGPAALQVLAPGIAPGLRGLMVGEDWRLDPRPALASLRAAAVAAGVELRTEAFDGRPQTDWLVIATGAARGLAEVAPELGHIQPIKGQILRFKDRRGGRVSLRGRGAYAVPGGDGLAIGATMEVGRSDTRIDPAALRPLIAASEALFPDLAGATFTASAGVRAATPDGLPMAGLSRSPGVILATGARRNGWLLAPLVADIVTACVTGRESGPYAARLDPRRFPVA